MFQQLSNFDANPKTQEEYNRRTWHGGIASIIALSCILYLLFINYHLHFQVEYIDKMYVDNTRNPKERINFNITFTGMPCLLINIDVSDTSGNQHKDIEHGIQKTRLSLTGKRISEGSKIEKLGGVSKETNSTKSTPDCGSCYNAGEPGECCNTCDDVKKAYAKKNWAFPSLHEIKQCMRQEFEDILNNKETEGCNIDGYIEVARVAGTLTFSPGKIFQSGYLTVNDLVNLSYDIFNNTHIIHNFAFGYDNSSANNGTLNNRQKTLPKKKQGIFEYFLKVVGTDYTYLNQTIRNATQYSVTEHFRELEPLSNKGVTGITFTYDFSPIMFHTEEQRGGILSFLVSTCSVVGGILTVTGVFDSIVDIVLRKFSKRTHLAA